MGLDMYLNRYPKLGLSVDVMDGIEEMWEWRASGKDKEYSLKDWCDFDENDLPVQEIIDVCEKYRHTSYYAWDEEKRYPRESMKDNVAYWRKANAIHGWFERVLVSGDDGNGFGNEPEELENCKPYLVTKDDLECLRDDCRYVIENSKLVPGKVINGYRYEKDGGWTPNLIDGNVIEDATACEDVLPTQKGFFFGSTEYNEWYLEDVKYTYNQIEKILKETDFTRYEIIYCASW